MKTNYLFPHHLKLISGTLFVIALLLIVAKSLFEETTPFELQATVFALVDDNFDQQSRSFSFITTDVSDEIIMLLLIGSGLIFAFTKEKHEDEMVSSIRLHSLAWATIANYMILLFCYLFIYGLPFLNVLMIAMFSQLVIFIVLFRYRMFRFYNTRQDEE